MNCSLTTKTTITTTTTITKTVKTTPTKRTTTVFSCAWQLQQLLTRQNHPRLHRTALSADSRIQCNLQEMRFVLNLKHFTLEMIANQVINLFKWKQAAFRGWSPRSIERLKSIENNIGRFLAKMLNRKHCQRHHGSESCVLLINQRLILSQFLVSNAVNGGPSKLRNLYSDVPPPTHKKHKSWKSSCGYNC